MSDDIDLGLYSGQWSQVEAAANQRLERAESDAGEMIITGGELTLEAAIARAILNDGELSAIAATMQAETLDAESDSKMPEPKVRLMVRDVAGSGSMSGTDAMDQQFRVTQTIELGGKGEARRRVGELQAAVTGSRRYTRRLNVILNTSQAFYNMLAAEKFAELETKRITEIEKLVKELKNLGGLDGADSQVISRCELMLAVAKSDFIAAKSELDSSRARLAASWGDMRVSFEKISGDLNSLGTPIALEELASRLEGVPDIYEYEAERHMYSAERELAERNKIPDIEIHGGLRRDDDSGDHGFFAGIEVELPVWNWAGREVRAASRRVTAAESRRRGRIASAACELAEAHGKLFSAYSMVQTLENTLIPATVKALELAKKSQAAGAEDPWEIARALDDYFDARADLIDARLDYHLSRLKVERLTAGKAVVMAPKVD